MRCMQHDNYSTYKFENLVFRYQQKKHGEFYYPLFNGFLNPKFDNHQINLLHTKIK